MDGGAAQAAEKKNIEMIEADWTPLLQNAEPGILFARKEMEEEHAVLLAECPADSSPGQEDLKALLVRLCQNAPCPVVLFSEEPDIQKELAALEAGAADYVTRQMDVRVTAARLYAAARIPKYTRAVTEDRKQQFVSIDDAVIQLTQLESAVFHCLLQKKGSVLSRKELFQQGWSGRQVKNMRVVDTVVKQLRKKLQKTRFAIAAKYNLGYVLYDRIQP